MKRINIYSLRQVKEKSGLYELDTKRILSPDTAAEIIRKVLELDQMDVEYFGILTLNNKNEVAGAHILGKGTINTVIATPRDIFKAALMNNAISVILFHNHPSGDPTPSPEDIQMTKRVEEAGQIIGIDVLDHIIIGHEGRFYSLKANGLI
ncbi:JAB domain-containing protein [Paenibacillus alkalitolerans]|uniref:JAB domain-containing protein n=1 Tax=Paenibacillus alkalitolerans TaxID=2799335 RepID=UPI0018F74CB0|nr:JAB domain-containing protein [Paenibacillus alkalitolerans]